MTEIIRIAHHSNGHAPEPIEAARLLTGSPQQIVANAYSDPGNAFHCGVWEADVGSWRVTYTEHEFCHVLAGRIRLRGDDGSDVTVQTGDSFVIPAGFAGVWEVLEPARKLYAIYEPPA